MRLLTLLIAACCVFVGGCPKKNQELGGEPAASARPATAREYTNAHLIAAMPEGVEGVMVERLEPLAAPDSVVAWMFGPSTRQAWETWYGEESLGADAKDLWPVAYLASLRAGPLVRATGGSHFKIPAGIGMGDVRQRMIVVVERPLTALRERLEVGGGVNGLRRHPGDPVVYSAPSYVVGEDLPQREVFVALPDEHTLVMGTSLDEARSMCAALRAGASAIPARWAAAAEGMKLDSPVVVLRTYHPDRTDDWSTPFRQENGRAVANVEALCATMESASKPELRLRCVSPEPEKARAFYDELTGPGSTRRFSLTPFGFEGTVGPYSGPDDDEDGAASPEQVGGEIYMRAYTLYGQNIAL